MMVMLVSEQIQLWSPCFGAGDILIEDANMVPHIKIKSSVNGSDSLTGK